MSNPWPLIAPLPGVSRTHLRASLHQLWTEASNIRGGTYGSGFEQLARYLNWASSAVRTLANQIKPADIDRLILTRGYERLLTLAAPSSAVGSHTVSVMNEMLNLELSQRVDDLEAARDSLSDAISRWSDSALFIMPDTSVYIEHEKKLADLDFAELVADQRFPDSRLVVLVPIVVIDELDRLKDRSSNSHVKWRAGHALGFIYEKLRDADHPALIQPPEPQKWRGPVVMELILDPPGYVRLPTDDDEIVDRAQSIGALTESRVTLITFDTGQSLRARNADLRVVKLTKPQSEEDDPGPPSRRQVRRERKAARETSAEEAPPGSNA
jgi:hypothetical protein